MSRSRSDLWRCLLLTVECRRPTSLYSSNFLGSVAGFSGASPAAGNKKEDLRETMLQTCISAQFKTSQVLRVISLLQTMKEFLIACCGESFGYGM